MKWDISGMSNPYTKYFLLVLNISRPLFNTLIKEDMFLSGMFITFNLPWAYFTSFGTM